MIISSVKNFIEMSHDLEEIGFSNIHFYNSTNDSSLNAPMIALVPFVDFLILGSDAGLSPNLNRLINEAQARHIPVIREECINKIGSICNIEKQNIQ